MKTSHSALTVATLAVVASAAAGLSSAMTAYVMTVGVADPNSALYFVNPRSQDIERPSSRTEMTESSTTRDGELFKRLQERRIERIQENMQDADAVHESAPEETVTEEADQRAFHRAYRYCRFRGYTRSRLALCVDDMIEYGEYDPMRD